MQKIQDRARETLNRARETFDNTKGAEQRCRASIPSLQELAGTLEVEVEATLARLAFMVMGAVIFVNNGPPVRLEWPDPLPRHRAGEPEPLSQARLVVVELERSIRGALQGRSIDPQGPGDGHELIVRRGARSLYRWSRILREALDGTSPPLTPGLPVDVLGAASGLAASPQRELVLLRDLAAFVERLAHQALDTL